MSRTGMRSDSREREGGGGGERRRERKSVCLYVCMCMRVCAWVRVAPSETAMLRLPVLRLPMLRCERARAPPRDFTSSTCRLFLALSPGLPAICVCVCVCPVATPLSTSPCCRWFDSRLRRISPLDKSFKKGTAGRQPPPGQSFRVFGRVKPEVHLPLNLIIRTLHSGPTGTWLNLT